MENKVRKIYKEDLPRYRGNNISWQKCVGYKLKFDYDEIHGVIEILKYNKGILSIKYLDKPFEIGAGNLLSCRITNILGKRTHDFKIEIGDTFKDDKRDITIVSREYKKRIDKKGKVFNDKWYYYRCNKCGFCDDRSLIIESGLLNGGGCSCCHGKTTVEGINSIVDTDPWMIKYFQGGYNEAKQYSKGSNVKIYPICPDCGRIKDKKLKISNIYTHHSIGCGCSDSKSYPNKFGFALFNQLNIEFKIEYSPNWAESRSYDFYFEKDNIKYIVEMDGMFHYMDNTRSGQTKEESQKIDDYKDDLADNHGIKVIRIECKKSQLEYIKNNILDSNLNKLFDLNLVDWLKCEEGALSNLAKISCDYKRDNPTMTTSEIGKLVGLQGQTVTRYLNQGVKLGWCNYDPVKEHNKVGHKYGSINGKKGMKKLEMFKDSVSLGIFESAGDLVQQSEKLFNVKLVKSLISSVCSGRRNLYKGYTFKYI